ncbi:MAG: anti-sigma factor [Candidatus Omnitrophota bacterium]
MDCKNIQELLKSDYLDGELRPARKQLVREHLLKCPACRELLARLKTQRGLIMSAKKEIPPERVWHNIRRAITTERTGEESKLRSLLERLRERFFMPRPVFAVATALAAIICVVFVAGAITRTRPFYAGNGEDIFTIYTLNGESSDSLNDFGTAIEEYFL